MNITAIKNVIKDNPRVILYFGSDRDSFVAVTKATGGFIPAHTEGCTELCLLYADGRYDGFNRENSIEFLGWISKRRRHTTLAGLSQDAKKTANGYWWTCHMAEKRGLFDGMDSHNRKKIKTIFA